MSVLVTGGAGYIGSHMVQQLVRAGRETVVVDNLFRGHREAVHPDAAFFEADIADVDTLTSIIRKHRVESVIHFAALAYVGESTEQPDLYYRNNTGGTERLLEAMDQTGVKRIVFSSTCATYGLAEELPMSESHPQRPENPYGWSKLYVEKMLQEKVVADPEFGFTALRYFNVAGCAGDGSVGEHHDPETHLIPILLQVALGQRDHVVVYGNDYPTPDGTCIRDYVHVEDLCNAHLLAEKRTGPGDARFCNLGNGKGFSVNEVIESVQRVTGKKIPVEYGPRRAGDPPELWASAAKAERELGWKREVPKLDDIVATAWKWFCKHPHGYGPRAL